ncbi:MAG: hypothetical protein COA63_006550 [Methylophaga sp.]|nr:hypothetical protein [Methylophaga sp.]
MKNDLLKKLGETKLKELISRYYSSEKISDLIEEFQLDIKISGLYKLFPLKELKDNKCAYCNIALKQRYPSRSSLKYNQPIAFCGTCEHRDIFDCFCNHCKVIENEMGLHAIAEHQRKIGGIQTIRTDNVNLTDLSLMQAISLLGMCRLGRGEDSDLISPVNTYYPELAPTEMMTIDIVESLYAKQLIDIALTTPEGTVTFNEVGSLIDFDLLNVHWCLNLSKNESNNVDLIEQLEEMVRKKELWPNTWEGELLDIWKELALHQCYRYLQILVEDHGFQFRAGKKTRKILSVVLEDFSILKSYYFIWVAVHNAASYYLRNTTSKRQAANMIIGDIQRRSERALAEEWDVKEYSKNSRCGESILIALFSTLTTSLGRGFFTKIPVISAFSNTTRDCAN